MAKKQSGICYLTGAGPGDLGLVTLKARQVLETAEAVIYDALCNPEMLAWAPKEAERIGTGEKNHALAQKEINALLVRLTQAGKRVVRLTEGDPLLSGHGGEEAEALAAAKLPFDIIPGIHLPAPSAGPEDRSKPLFGKRIVVTRSRAQGGPLAYTLRALGADAYELPTIRIEPPADLLEFGQLVQECHTYDWLVFTSVNGVDAFFQLFFKLYDDTREIGGVRIAAIGSATAARLRELHLHVDLEPESFVAEAVVKAFAKDHTVENEKILIIRPEKARDVLMKELTKMGAIVDEAIAYRTVPETDLPGIARFREEGADLVTFASSSAVENFLALNLPLPPSLRTASIGPVTSKTMQDLGLRVDVEAKRHDIPGLTAAIRAFYQS